jgi:hypothetical protein
VKRTLLGLVVLAAAVPSRRAAVAQEGTAPVATPTSGAGATRGRDPFGTTMRMRELAGNGAPAAPTRDHATGEARIVLRGVAEVRGKPPLALLEIDGQVLLVRAGDSLGGQRKVRAIEGSSVILETNVPGQLLVIR